MSDTRAIITIIGIFIFALTAFVIVSVMAWRSNVELFKRAVPYIRTFPDRVRLYLRMRRDPELRWNIETVGAYENAIELMMMMQAKITIMEKAPTGRPAARERRLDVAREAYMTAKREAAVRICGFDTSQLSAVAAHISTTYLEGKVPIGQVYAFLLEEQTLLSRNVHEAPRHLTRIIMRFGPEIAPAA